MQRLVLGLPANWFSPLRRVRSGPPARACSRCAGRLVERGRLAMWLRTTRANELEWRFDERRRKKPDAGRSRRNVSREGKNRIAASMAPTTLFDVLWRMRKKASYEDADVFVLGAAGAQDARRFAESLVTVTDATVAAIEAVISQFPDPLRTISRSRSPRHGPPSTLPTTAQNRP